MTSKRLLEARVSGAAGADSRADRDINSLPPDLLQDASRRLQIACLIWAALAVTALLVNNLVAPRLIGGPLLPDRWPWPGNAIISAIVLVSLSLFWYLRRIKQESRQVLNLGLIYEVILAAGIGILNQWVPVEMNGPSWIAILILLHPLIIPNSPRRVLFASLLAASMDPLGIAVATVRGEVIPQLGQIALDYFPNYVAVVLAVIHARILGHMGQKIRQARELGSYQLVALIGQGGMGEVWRASHCLLARPAAIKLINPDALGAATPEEAGKLIERFRDEAENTASLHCPHTIDLFDFGLTADGTFYLAMELLEGLNLESAVQQYGPMPAARVVHILRQCCSSLAEAHSRGIIHRDIKPANLFICRLGLEADFVKVLDFGLAKRTDDAKPRAVMLTEPGVASGTPAYMPPEVALGEKVTHLTDLYALGCVGYWLLTGRLVFQADSAMRMIIQHCESSPVPPSRHAESVPPKLESVLLACLEKRPQRRPANALTLFRMLGDSIPRDEQWTERQAHSWWDVHMSAAPGQLAYQPPAAASPTVAISIAGR
jgi:eukaryotic-like serine/threonine-protein kinase